VGHIPILCLDHQSSKLYRSVCFFAVLQPEIDGLRYFIVTMANICTEKSTLLQLPVTTLCTEASLWTLERAGLPAEATAAVRAPENGSPEADAVFHHDGSRLEPGSRSNSSAMLCSLLKWVS